MRAGTSAPANINSLSTGRTQIVLLPGMDGTGNLFADFTEALASDIEAVVLRYPSDVRQSYAQLFRLVQYHLPSSTRFVLVAESFSAPLAMQLVGEDKTNLKGLVICSGFANSPVRGWLRSLCLRLSSICFWIEPPTSAIRCLLVGREASDSLVVAVRSAIRSVRPTVLDHRLRLTLTCDSRSALRGVKVPMLFIQPTEDRLVSSDCLKEMREVTPDAAVEWIQGPHLILHKRSKETAEVIGRFVQQLSTV
jgi:pimeloyl-[acyl-carrier protein] methyl ester esterase